MTMNFPLILVNLVIITGLIAFFDLLFWAHKRRRLRLHSVNPEKPVKAPLIVDWSRSLFVILLIVLLIRSFLLQPMRVPTGSLKPTIMPGDFILVNMFDYGIRLPVLKEEVKPIDKPKLGDITVFYWPVNPNIRFVKRVVGVPGDSISYIDKVLYINGKKMPQKFLHMAKDSDGNGPTWPVKVMQEDLNGVKHDIYLNPKVPARNFYHLIVPKGDYFMMGDNRDNSDDSRYWGFVPNQDILGKAFLVWMSWNSQTDRVRWQRIGNKV